MQATATEGQAGTAPITSAAPGINGALAAVMRAVSPITKDRNNQQQNFKFRGIDDVYNELHKLFADNGVFVLPQVLDHKITERTTAKGGQSLHHVVKVRYVLQHQDGSSVSCELYGEAADTGDKGAGKAQQYAYKVALLQMFLIPTEGDDDPDAQSTEWGRGGPPQNQPARNQQGGGQAQRAQQTAPAGRQAASNQARGLSEGEVKKLANQLKTQLCAAATLAELAQRRGALRNQLLELQSASKKAYEWLIGTVGDHEEVLKQKEQQPE